MEKVLAVVHEHDFNVTPAGDDDVQSYTMSLCHYSVFSDNWKKEKFLQRWM